ncbi:hypothetical protein ACE1B6_24080 [Aerosakkonemataceae cyanobacterium BLCC-F154]|uniref:Tail sheath protein n=1 Tax=Floridaenema fluviatile BLCC-F154 TaxID=3153640 RepID=A0ABV4YHU0_9CYAN
MALINSILDRSVPGVYVTEDTFGAFPAGIATHSTVYMLGFSSKVDAPVGVPALVQSTDDFYNQFGTSASTNSVALFFAQRSGLGFYFVNVATKATRTFTVATATPDEYYTITVDTPGYDVTYRAVTGDTPDSIVRNLVDLVNKNASHVMTARRTGDATGELRFASGLASVASANIALGTIQAKPSYPVVWDVVDTINSAFEPEMKQGFIIAPEFFQNFTSMADRNVLANTMESLASDPSYYWVAIADCGQDVATQTTSAGAVNLAIQERNGLQSPRGHLAFYFPYWVDARDNLVPMSASVVGVALRRYRDQGFREPPAGTAFPVYGVKDISYKVTDKIQSSLNPVGVNCGRHLSAGRGRVIYGARTVSNNPYYRFVSTRVIMNVLAGSLRGAFDSIIFSSVDGLGVLFGRIKQTAVQFCERLRLAGALFGATPDDAYLCICDLTNNPAIDLENGQVNLDVLAKPSPVMEVLNIRLSRVSLGTVLAEVASSGDRSPVNNPEVNPQSAKSSQPATANPNGGGATISR